MPLRPRGKRPVSPASPHCHTDPFAASFPSPFLLVPLFSSWFFASFKDSYYGVALAFFLRRLVVALFVSLVPKDNGVRYAGVAVVILSSAVYVMVKKPYRAAVANELDAFALTTSLVIYLFSFIVANDDYTQRGLLVVITIIIQVVALSLFAFVFYKLLRGTLRGTAERLAVLPIGNLKELKEVDPVSTFEDEEEGAAVGSS